MGSRAGARRFLPAALAFMLVGHAAAQPHAAPAAEARQIDSQRLLDEGWFALSQRRFEDARGAFLAVLRLDPERPEANAGLGDALFWLGDFAGSLTRYERATASAPAFAHAHSGIGHACLNLMQAHPYEPRTRAKLLARSHAAFDRALQLDPSHRGAREGLHHVSRLERQAASLRPLEFAIFVLLVSLTGAAAWTWRGSSLSVSARGWGTPIALFLATRAVIWLAFVLAPRALPEARGHPLALIRDDHSALIDATAGRWDANLYVDVARNGYSKEGSSEHWATVGQFPLLPIAFRWVSYALDDERVAALLVPNVALGLAVVCLFAWLREREGEAVARRACAVLLLLPGGLYGAALYAEPTALLFLAIAAAGTTARNPVVALTAGTLAGLSRPNAIAAVPWLLWLGLDAARGDGRLQARARALASSCGPVLGIAGFAAYCGALLGDPLAYVHELRAHRLADGGPFVALSELVREVARGPLDPHGLPVIAFVAACGAIALCLAATTALVRSRHHGEALFVATALGLALTSSLAAAPRYAWLALPAAFWLGRASLSRRARIALEFALATLLFACASAFARWYYVT